MRRIYENYAYGPGPVAENFWRSTVRDIPSWPKAEGEVSCEFAIVGAGFTGLNAALELSEAGADVVLLEGEDPAWGASGRNGGFASLGGDMCSDAALVRRFGAEDVAVYRRAQRASIEQVAENLAAYDIDADTHSDGETQLAHSPHHVEALRAKSQAFEASHGVRPEVLTRDALPAHGLGGPGFHGAMTMPFGFALNPMKYALGLAKAASARGVRLFAQSPVTHVTREHDHWRLTTPTAVIRARKLLMATNGYSSDDLPDWFASRYLPVQSNILVSRPLTDSELADQGFTTSQMCFDTRRLLHYFRLLPDRRMLFGMRGATSARPAALQAMKAKARADFNAMFPAWSHVETPYFWSGLLCLSRGLTPFAGPLGDLPDAWGAMAYHGDGVAMGSYSGRLIGEMALGNAPRRPCPKLMQATPRRFELGGFRRAVLPFVYKWYQFRDLSWGSA